MINLSSLQRRFDREAPNECSCSEKEYFKIVLQRQVTHRSRLQPDFAHYFFVYNSKVLLTIAIFVNILSLVQTTNIMPLVYLYMMFNTEFTCGCQLQIR